MILPDRGIIFVEIAKNGSRSVVWGCKRKKYKTRYDGHKPLSFLIDRYPDYEEIIAVTRHPVDRLVSALNYQERPRTLDDKINKALYGDDVIYRPQYQYLDVDVPVTLYDIESLDLLLEYLGIDQDLHENKGPVKHSREEIFSHPLYDELLAKYKPDFKLYADSKRPQRTP